MVIEHSYPHIGKAEEQAIIRVMKTKYLAEGEQVKKFEIELSNFIGGCGAVAASTGTLALHLALVALGIGRGDEVIAPSYTCRSVLNAIMLCGAEPVLCDVSREDFNISFISAKKKLSPRTKTIIIPHMFGCPAEIDKFTDLGIKVIEDCAHSIGAEYKGKKVGSRGDLSIFSFEGTKYIIAGEGGMVVANSSELLSKLKILKEPDSFDFSIKYTYRMTDLQAAVARVQLKRIKKFIEKRRAIARNYDANFKNIIGLGIPDRFSDRFHIYHRYMLYFKGDIRKFMDFCFKQGVKVKQPVKPYPLHTYMNLSDKDFPNTAFIMNKGISIPIYPALSKKQVKFIGDVIRKACMELE